MSRKDYLPIVALVILSLLFHLIGSFFLYDFSNDEGEYLINAKNMVLFDQFSLEGIYNTALAPLQTFFHVFIFELFSPSIFIGRYVSIIFTMALLVLFYIFVNKWYGWKIAAFAVFLITVNGIFNRYTTFAIMEAKIYFFAILTLLFCFSTKAWVRRLSFLPFSLCLGFKPTLVYLALPVAYALSIGSLENYKLIPKFSHKTFLDIAIFLVGTILLTGLFFYLAYIINPKDFISWAFREEIIVRIDLYTAIKNLFSDIGILSALFYFCLRAPITSLCFLWGIFAAIREKKKTPVDIFLFFWVLVEIGFYLIQPSVHSQYVVDLIFPLSILSGKAILNSFSQDNLRYMKNYVPQLILVLIAIFQIGSSFYFFLVSKPERPAMETVQWLNENSASYKTVIAPVQVIVNFPKKSLIASNSSLTIEDVLSEREITYPLLCIVQKSGAVIHKEDNLFLRMRGKLINKIGNFWIYEVLE